MPFIGPTVYYFYDFLLLDLDLFFFYFLVYFIAGYYFLGAGTLAFIGYFFNSLLFFMGLNA